MFTTKLSRVASRATCSATNSVPASAQRSTSCLAHPRTHQRRHSSSKASCPPDSSPNGGKPAPAAKNGSEKSPIADTTSQPRASRTKTRKARTSTTSSKQENQFAALPAVPGTQHIDERDFKISSFFALHRPIAVGTTVPRPSTSEEFGRIFETRKEANPWENGNSAEGRPENVVIALSNFFEDLDITGRESQDDGVRWEVMQESPSHQDGIIHLDGQPRMKSLDEQIANLRPFRPPPPPQPFLEEMPKLAEKKRGSGKANRKSYETRIIVTEYTDRNGQRTYRAESSPIVRIDTPNDPAVIKEPISERTQDRIPFLERVRLYRRQVFQLKQGHRVHATSMPGPMRRAPSANRRNVMLAISVKRQRKLKMKKHKYKKLMKRTRNLRRRQDRI